MSDEFTACGKVLLALHAFVRLETKVNVLVVTELHRIFEHLLAKLALVLVEQEILADCVGMVEDQVFF